MKAELNEIFYDGCNKVNCTESRKNKGPWPLYTDTEPDVEKQNVRKAKLICTCRYQNWGKIWGYATSGQRVPVWDPKGDYTLDSGCPKYCPCEPNKKGRKEKVNCKSEPCIWF